MLKWKIIALVGVLFGLVGTSWAIAEPVSYTHLTLPTKA